ncbi:MAG: hypothetical protein ACRCSN_20890 [Dermatophilaceae bacterium]
MDQIPRTRTSSTTFSRRLALGAGLASAGALTFGDPAVAASPGFPLTVALPDGIRPEGITSGPGTRFYVGSLADGRLVAGDLRTGAVGTLLPGEPGRSLRGLYWDRRTDLVWAAGGLGDEAHVWAVDGRTGAVVSDTIVPGAAFLNDLVRTGRTVWVTDSRLDRLTAIPLDGAARPTGGAPEFVTLRGEWRSGDGTEINANGIRALDDGWLLLNNSRVGGLWRVNPHTGGTRRIPVVGGGPPLIGGDGLVLDGSTLYDVRGSGDNQVSVLRLQRLSRGWIARWRGALFDSTLDVPSTATVAEGFVWAVNARFGVANPDTASYSVTRLDPR